MLIHGKLLYARHAPVFESLVHALPSCLLVSDIIARCSGAHGDAVLRGVLGDDALHPIVQQYVQSHDSRCLLPLAVYSCCLRSICRKDTKYSCVPLSALTPLRVQRAQLYLTALPSVVTINIPDPSFTADCSIAERPTICVPPRGQT